MRLAVLSLSLSSLPTILGFVGTGGSFGVAGRLPAACCLFRRYLVHVGGAGRLVSLPAPSLRTKGGRKFVGMPVVKMGAVLDGQDLKELFDVYEPPDEEFRRTGVPRKKGHNKERGRVHADGDWHRAVHIWLYTPKGDFVLQQRSSPLFPALGFLLSPWPFPQNTESSSLAPQTSSVVRRTWRVPPALLSLPAELNEDGTSSSKDRV